MKKGLLIFLSLLLATVILASPLTASAATLAERLQGHFLLSVQEHGELWYVHPDTDQRIYLADEDATWQLILSEMIGITNADLNTLINNGKRGDALYQQLKGRFLLAVEQNGEVLYVDPQEHRAVHNLGSDGMPFKVLRFVSLGITKADLAQIPVSDQALAPAPDSAPAPAPQPSTPAPEPEPVDSIPATDFMDAQAAWDFTNGLWLGYEQYHAAFNDYPSIDYFNSLLSFNLPIYFNETGFSLDSGTEEYFLWDNFSDDWQMFYDNHFSFVKQGDRLLMSFALPEAVETVANGTLAAGTHYFTSDQGLLDQEAFEASNWNLIKDQALDAERVITAIEDIREALAEYWQFIRGYPVTANGQPVILGENGAVKLTHEHGFFGQDKDVTTFLERVESGFPTTEFSYISTLTGSTYTITFSIFGEYDEYEPGVYEAKPGGIQRIGDLEEL